MSLDEGAKAGDPAGASTSPLHESPSPANAGGPPPVRAKAPARGSARWLDTVTTLVLGAIALVLGVAAMPSLLRAAAGAASDAHEFAPPIRGKNESIVPGVHHGWDRPDDDDAEPPPRLPMGLPTYSPNDPRVRPPRFPGDRSGDAVPDDEAAPGFEDLGLKGGVIKKPLALRDRRTSSVLQELKPGEKVHILREDGDWVLVVKGGDASLVTGWARRSELVLR